MSSAVYLPKAALRLLIASIVLDRLSFSLEENGVGLTLGHQRGPGSRRRVLKGALEVERAGKIAKKDTIVHIELHTYSIYTLIRAN